MSEYMVVTYPHSKHTDIDSAKKEANKVIRNNPNVDTAFVVETKAILTKKIVYDIQENIP